MSTCPSRRSVESVNQVRRSLKSWKANKKSSVLIDSRRARCCWVSPEISWSQTSLFLNLCPWAGCRHWESRTGLSLRGAGAATSCGQRVSHLLPSRASPVPLPGATSAGTQRAKAEPLLLNPASWQAVELKRERFKEIQNRMISQSAPPSPDLKRNFLKI